MKKINTTVVIGAGPVGIAAAAHLMSRGIKPVVLEKGKVVGSAMLSWGHVKVFTPWKYVVDKAVVSLLEKNNWSHPEKEHLPTGREIVEEYLIPAAATPELYSSIVYGAEVIGVAKTNLSKSVSKDRENTGFTVHYKTADGETHSVLSDAVIDASGTWYTPNPIGLDGLPVSGEKKNKENISYGIPDVLRKSRSDYEGKRTLVIGGGHSAINVSLDLLTLQNTSKETKVFWGLREDNIEKLLGGGINDELPARGALGISAKRAIDSGALELLIRLQVLRIEKVDNGMKVNIDVDGVDSTIEVDRIVVAAGFRPDLNILRELRLDLDEIIEAPTILAPLIDPNLHSCGTIRPHGVNEITHFDKNFYIAGMKAYGRAPTFLMLTGYEQVRSISAELAGNHEAARKIELELPQTGVCSSNNKDNESACCVPDTSLESSSCCSTSGSNDQSSYCG